MLVKRASRDADNRSMVSDLRKKVSMDESLVLIFFGCMVAVDCIVVLM